MRSPLSAVTSWSVPSILFVLGLYWKVPDRSSKAGALDMSPPRPSIIRAAATPSSGDTLLKIVWISTATSSRTPAGLT